MTSKTNNPPEQKLVEIEPLEAPTNVASQLSAVRNAKVDSVKVTLTVEIGRVSMTIKELRGTRQGTVIPLDRGVGDPIDIRANGVLIARGEVVSTEGHKYGIRVTEIVSPEDAEALP